MTLDLWRIFSEPLLFGDDVDADAGFDVGGVNRSV